jgi:hypothetical protein
VRAASTSLTTGIAVGIVAWLALSTAGVVAPQPAARAATPSAVTVRAAEQDADIANAPFPGLTVTVSQTTGLVAQGIDVSWSGAVKSTVPTSQTGGANFLQIMQCWGDDATGGPDRETCQYGAVLTPGATRDGFRSSLDAVAGQDLTNTDPGSGFFDPAYTSIPFRGVDGDVIASVVDGEKVSVDVNTNRYFTQYTSNEVPWAGSGNDGSGSVDFEVQTAMQAPGLGCGEAISGPGNTVTGRSCWLVIVPRGTSDPGESQIVGSGLFWDAWKHRVAIRLEFKPLGVRCDIGAAERQLAGSELVAAAIASWQPALCGSEGGSAYSLISGPESDAAVAANGSAPAPLALTSRPLTGATDKLRYAPIALTGISVVFAIDREPSAAGDVPAEVIDRARLAFEHLNLTPRLIAKLLTASYVDSLPTGADRTHLGTNPRNLLRDPDFLAINDPEWAHQAIISPAVADLLVPQGRSDAAWAVWNYVLSDPDAVAFLAGEPDPWGMTVNPYSATDAQLNPTGTAFAVPRDNFPKADPIEQAAVDGGGGPVNLVTWRPYTTDLDTSGYLTLRGDGLVVGDWDPVASPPRYGKKARSLPGLQRVLGLTTTASAERYQVVSAALRNPAGEFVTPTVETLLAAAEVMTPDPAQSQVVRFDPASTAAKGATDAYPLTVPVYAAANPAMADASLRADYADFIRYAATTGQASGTADGQLPAGYAPLPEAWRSVARSAADAIQSGAPGSPTPVPSPTGSLTTLPLGGGSGGSGTGGSLDPSATGDPALELLGNATPDDPDTGSLPAAIPISILAGLAAAVAVPILSRRKAAPTWNTR